MRRVDAEGDSRGGRVQKQEGARLRSRLRRASIESLERRELLSTSTSTLPSPTVISAPNLALNLGNGTQIPSVVTAAQALTGAPSANSPSVSVDPINPLKMVAVWVDHDAAGYAGGNFTAPITSYLEGAYSTNGGSTWTPLTATAFGTGGFGRGASVNVQQDFSVTPPTGSVTVFTETTDATIGFDRNENFYILSSTHNVANTAGVLDLQRFSFVGTNAPTYSGYNPVYSWDQPDSAANGGTVDQALTPTLAVDTNVPTYTDPTSGHVQTDQYSGNIYIAWAEIDSEVYDNVIPNFNPNTIKLAVSSDQGLEFTHASYVDDSANANGHNTGVVTNPPPPQYPLHDSSARYAAPQIAISQGNASGTVPAGQVTLVYDDYGSQAPIDRIIDQTDLIGGTSEQFSYTNAQQVPNVGSAIPITVNITDPKFVTLQDLEVTTTIAWPNISEIGAVLIPPASVTAATGITSITLFAGDVGINNSSGTPSSSANLGDTSGSGSTTTAVRFSAGSGTVFDPESVRSIENGAVGLTAVGHFEPDGESAFLALKGLTAAQLNGTWMFETQIFTADTSTSPKFVNGVTLNFTSGNNPGAAAGAAGAEVTVADKNTLYVTPVPNINPTNTASALAYGVVYNTDNNNSQYYDGVSGTNVSGSGDTASNLSGKPAANPTVSPVQGAIPLLPAPVIASDNTLGSYSQHEGRIYVSFTGKFSDAQAGNTDIFLLYSDDGGKTWSAAQQVNDDNAAVDGYSGASTGAINLGGTATTLGRTQYEPQIAVDQSTGDVVLSWLDARNDPSNARVATYIAVSSDGATLTSTGASGFAADVYANPTQTATDAITGNVVNIGPIPDNQSTTGGVEDADAFGTHQALIVVNGRIIPFWASNENETGLYPYTTKLQIVDSILSLTAGPRIISSTQGPVGVAGDTLNTTRASDGTTLANAIEVTFDQPIDPSTFLTSNVGVFYESPSGVKLTTSLPIVSVTALNTTALGATEFKIVFNPSGLASFVGTYSYVIYPAGISNRIRSLNAPVETAGVFNYAAPAGAGVSASSTGYASSSVTVSGHPKQFLIGNPTGTTNLVNAAYPTGNVAGTITATITAGTLGGPNPPLAADFTVNLVTPDGQRVLLKGVVSNNGTGTTYTLNATKFTVPWVNTVALDGNYTLEVIDNPLNETITISSWQLTLNGVVSTPSIKLGDVMDQNANGVSGQSPGDDYVVGQPSPTNTFTSYAAGTLPLIVPGPHIIAISAVDPTTGAAISSGTNNLVLNNTVSVLHVTFDRNIQVSSFTTAQILGLFGPAGSVSLAGIVITPLTVYTPTGQVAYMSGGPAADVFKITFTTQQLSGTYALTIGTGILAVDGSGIDSNLNAGLDVLKGTATNGTTTPVTYVATSTAVPTTIQPAIVNSDGSTTDSVLMSPIVVPDDFPIQGDNGTISGITLSLNIAYANDPDLVAYLLAPDGVTKVNLFTNVGGGTNTANFSSTTFSDTATTSIDKAGAPFFGTFIPEAPFANLTGIASLGTWTLVIDNGGFSTGMLTSWSLTFRKPVSATGLAEDPDDRTTTYFQIFNLAASNALANSTWTAVGPAGITTSSNGVGTFAGAVSTIAVDPSDKTGNTVFVGSASGGIWKTTDFLTTNPAGPTYVPLTEFGPNFSLNIGSIAIFGRNSDPTQSVIFAGTGFGQETTDDATGGYPNVDLNSGRGVGILRSTDGGLTWTLLDSLTNTDANGNTLPEAARDHHFIGDTTYKVIVDPTPELDGQIIVYAALGGPTGGLYQSLDSGNTWKLLSASLTNPNLSANGQNYADATDVLLDPNSKSPTTGNLDIVYAAFPGFGVYVSSNQGQTLQLVAGLLGKNPLIVGPGFPAQPIPVENQVSPNLNDPGDIVLAKPALTSNVAENLAYQGWLFAAVENPNGSFNGLYVTKDAGENWTKVQLPNVPGSSTVKEAIPTNFTTGVSSYDPTSSNITDQGTYNLTLTVDPTDPNIVYIGGSGDFQGSGLIRVDLTDLYDAHNFTSGSNDQSDGGDLFYAGQGGVTLATPANGYAYYVPNGSQPQSQLLNLRYAPNNGTPGTSPFNINATLVVNANTVNFINTGTGATWSLFDEPLKANAGDETGSTNLHDAIDYVDPITGDVRILFADDEGVFTSLVNPDGTLDNGIGSDVEPNYSRNGNLQDEQFFDSAAQPSSVASQAAGALFYASGQTTVAAQSNSNVLTNGDLTWDNSAVLSPAATSPRNTTANTSISTSDRSGVDIATDPTGSTAVYEFDVPILGGNLTDFFRVNQFGQTTGLANNVAQEFPQFGIRGSAYGGTTQPNETANGQIPIGNFVVNPLNGNQILIGSATGTLYETTNQGIQWLPIGSAINFDGGLPLNSGYELPQLSAIAYGAPDPNVSGGVGNLNNFIYVGTTGQTTNASGTVGSDGLFDNQGHIYVTQAGGNGWIDISSGLDGASIVGIYPAPDRGSHAAYAVTLTGVFFSPDTVGLVAAGQTVWTNITSNLTSIQYNPFGNNTYQQSVLAGFVGSGNTFTGTGQNKGIGAGTGQYGGFTDIVADYRYQIPAPTNATLGTNIYYPVLYVSGYGGVFRSIDNGTTWTVFPNTAFDAAPVDGGYLPSVDVSNLQLVLGDINPDTGHATQATGDPEVLLATTFGTGDYAIRLAPDVLPTSIQLDPTQPLGGSDSGISNTDLITNVTNPFVDGISEVSNYGNVVTIKLYDESPTSPYFGTLLGTGLTNQLGQFIHFDAPSGTYLLGIQVGATSDPWFNSITSATAGDKVIGIRATDSSGATGNLTLLKYTLDLVTPATPGAPVLEPLYDTGRSQTDGLTDLSNPAQTGPGAALTFNTAPIFDVTTAPTVNPLIPDPVSLTVELLRSSSPNGPFTVIDSVPGGLNSASSTVMLTDTDLYSQVLAGPVDATFYYEALQVDTAGNVSTPASNVTKVTVDTIAPAAPTALTLVTISSLSPPKPVFSVAGVLPGDQLFLYRSLGGQPAVQVGVGPINTGATAGTFQVTDTTGASPDGVYTYYAVQQDIFGNYSPLGTGLIVTINTQTPPMTPILLTDTGRSTTDDITNIESPPPSPGSTPFYVSPNFDVNAVAPINGQPAIASIQLFRATSPTGPFVKVGTVAYNGNPALVSDSTLANLAALGPIDQYFYYEADQINAAGIESADSGVLKVFVDTIVPTTLPTPTLDPASNTGLVKSQNITNITHPTFDATSLLPANALLNNLALGNQLLLYRSKGGSTPILVGTGPINMTNGVINATVTDAVGGIPDGVYVYQVVQQDVAGNISNFSLPIAVTINTTIPKAPTINLLTSDDTGLPSHPNVTSVNTPHFNGIAQYNAGTNFPVSIINVATGAVLATTYPSANGSYLAQVTTPLADGVYTLEARTTNLAGTFSFSAPLTVTIKHTGPQITPNLIILPADDTGIKGDGVTANHNPRFTGTTDPGDTVTLYAIINGQISAAQATTTSSTVNGSFTFRLPFSLTDGTTQLVAQTSDIANNKGVLSSALTVQIVTTTGDYLGIGAAQLTVFDPRYEIYYVQNTGSAQVDSTPGRDVPVQYDYNGDGVTDLAAYRFNTAEYFGYVSNGTAIDQQYGAGGSSLPVSGYFGNSGTFIYGSYQTVLGKWIIALPQANGLTVNFGVPMVDIPTPAAFNGFGSTELAVFRPTTVYGNDADSYSVIGPNGVYTVSFTNPAVIAKGFVYKAGDIPAPADYDGVGHDEFAIYRPSTGQFFILNTPSDTNTSTWSLRTVTLNLPGGPNAKDEPVSEDYDGDGKADPSVYRPSNSTFYVIHSSTNIQQNIQFGPANVAIAAAGPLLYRLTALQGAYISTGGYLPTTGGGGGGSAGIGAPLSILSVGSTPTSTLTSTTSSTPVASPLSTLIVLAAPITVTAPVASPTSALASTSVPVSTPLFSVTVGASTPKAFVPTVTPATIKGHQVKAAKSKKATEPLTVDSKAPEVHSKGKAAESATTKAHHTEASTAPVKTRSTTSTALSKLASAVPALQGLVKAKKGRKDS